MTIAAAVPTTIAKFLLALDEAIPGVVQGLYVVGSAVLDDFRPGISDLDFIAVTDRALGRSSLTALEQVHRLMSRDYPRSPLDGSYVSWDELRLHAGPATEGPCVVAGEFRTHGSHGRRPLDLHVLSRRAEVFRGPAVDALDLWIDHRALDHDVVGTVESTLRRWDGGASLSAGDALDPGVLSSGVLELCRMHYTLMTAAVTSKSNAGLYGLIAFPDSWRRLIDEALRIRRQPDAPALYPDPQARHRDARAFAELVARDVRELTGPQPRTSRLPIS